MFICTQIYVWVEMNIVCFYIVS